MLEQVVGRAEAAGGGVEGLAPRRAAGAGDVTGAGIDGDDLAGEPCPGPGVEHPTVGGGGDGGDLLGVGEAVGAATVAA